MNKGEKAVYEFNDGNNCAQATLSVLAEQLNISHEIAHKVASGFGGGFGRMQEICGAVSGACMALGLRYFNESDASDSRELVYKKVQDLMKKFSETHGTCNCSKLLGIDLLSNEGQAAFKDQNMKENKCCKYVKDAVAIAESLL